ncbi:FAD dependent oxidoreductase [Bimuria novae-zelandiae CBS 107.79]|uniref:FAD dependent oxidoreductase n=1 Tax=Bimuria novae-zelandiae CBS 107.79 TaxID=1447943 RepID=A0A6A5ULX2_9PLEO|nr:FAD dependent oxidoreductase [Bimuria novae-zelandiae CBS 107.79]
MIAYNIIKNNSSARVLMLEARDICSGATGRNGGHTKAASYRTYLQHKEELGKDEALRIARLEYANIIETHGLAKELGIECENQVCNTVDIIYDTQTFEQGKKAISELVSDATEGERRPWKMAAYRIYNRTDGVEQKFWVRGGNESKEVGKREDVEGAFEYLAGRIHAYRFTTGVLTHLVQQGLHLRANTPVHEFRPAQTSTSTPEAPLWDVFTPHTTLQAHNVVLATNGYTPYLVSALQGLIVPLRGQITAQKPPQMARHPSVLPRTYSFIYAAGYEYMIPRQLPNGGQHIVIGGGLGRLPDAGASEYGTVDDSAVNPEVSKYLRGTVAGYFGAPTTSAAEGGEAAYEIVKEWTGIMGATADGRPFVGEVPGKKGMWLCAGFNGHGMVLCVKAAEALVGMMGQDGGVEGLEWFPKSFLVSEERIEKVRFSGRMDMKVPERGEGAVGH